MCLFLISDWIELNITPLTWQAPEMGFLADFILIAIIGCTQGKKAYSFVKTMKTQLD